MKKIISFTGVLGGLICLYYSIDYLFSGKYGEVISIYYAGTLKNLNFIAIPLSILSLIGARNIMKNPKISSILLLLSSSGLFILLQPTENYLGITFLFITGLFYFLEHETLPG